MKQQAIQYLAFDVHRATVVASLRDASGRVVMRATVATEAKQILALVRSAGPRVHVAFEEGTQAQWLHDLVIDHAERVVVCNVRGDSECENKSDRLDADELSERLRVGRLKSVYHGTPEVLTLKELVRSYSALVSDTTRVMLRIKAILRARAIPTPGVSVYRASQRKEWLTRLEGGARVRATALLAQLDLLLELRPKAKTAMIVAARRLTKRNLWPYAGLAVVTRSSADQEFKDGKLRRRKRSPLTRGLNRNHNPTLKMVFKGAATSAIAKPGPLRELYQATLARGVKEDLAKVTLARKIAAVVLRLWKRGELWEPEKLTMQVT